VNGGAEVGAAGVAFDHDAAFRASWAIDETLRALEDLADGRERLGTDVLCSCSGPYADALRSEVTAATREADWLAEELRGARGRIAAARDEAFVEQARAEVQRALTAPMHEAPADPSGASYRERPS
jgi:hypothetical protein